MLHKVKKTFMIICLVVCAALFAPAKSAFAYDDSTLPSHVKEYLNNSLTATGWTKSDCSYFYVTYFLNGVGYVCTFLLHTPSPEYVDFHINSNGTNGNFALYSVYDDYYNHDSSSQVDFFWYSEEYNMGALNDTSTIGFGDFPFEVNTSFSPDYFVCNVPSAVSVNQVAEPIDTSSDTYTDALLWGYLQENGYDVEKPYAWIILYSGEPVQVPISAERPNNFTGDYWLKQSHLTPYLERFELMEYNDDINYSRYINSRVSIAYIHDVTTLDLYALYPEKDKEPSIDMYDDLPQGSVINATNLNALPNFYVFEGRSYIGKYLHYEGSENGSYPVYITYDIGNLASAIPRYNTLLLGVDLTVTDSNDTEIVGRNTTNYNNYVTNYNQEAVTGLTGYITGRTSFSGDWRGQNVNTTIPYSNNFTFSDNQVTNLFSRLWSMGDGFLTKAVLGVLSIALASYVLFGKH